MQNIKLTRFFIEQKSLITLICLASLAACLNHHFFSLKNIFNIMQQSAVNAIIAVGMTLVILTAGIDLTVGALLALSGAIIASMISTNFSIFFAISLAVFIGTFLGGFSGFIITKGRLQPFIATLVMMMIIRGFTLFYTDGKSISLGMNANSELFEWIALGKILTIPVPIWIMVVVFSVAWYLLNYARLGRHIYAVGGNEAAARLSGINIDRVKIIVYALSGLCCVLASIIDVARLSSAQVSTSAGYEMDAIAAVVLGGTRMSGGKGKILGTLIGALILGLINNALNLLNYNAYEQMIVKGTVILLAVLVDNKTSK